jgi:2',3'-cyclic-nucleotide 2'-phosphodiesterase (5'-nucleotidase family)
MHNTSASADKTGTHSALSTTHVWFQTLVVFLTLVFLPSSILAQEIKPIEPCPATPLASPTEQPRASEKLIDSSIPEDAEVLKVLEPYRAKVRELDVVIGTVEGDLKRSRVGGGSLGNFVADGLRTEAARRLSEPIALTLVNGGGLRKSSIAAGTLRVQDIFELLPFENALIAIDLTGEQLMKLLKAAINSGDAQSGALVTYKLKPDERPDFVSASLIGKDGTVKEIDPKALYRIVTIDYLYRLGSGNYAILREGKNMKPVGVTMRDALINYVKSETANRRNIRSTLDGRFKQVGTVTTEGATK